MQNIPVHKKIQKKFKKFQNSGKIKKILELEKKFEKL